MPNANFKEIICFYFRSLSRSVRMNLSKRHTQNPLQCLPGVHHFHQLQMNNPKVSEVSFCLRAY